MGQLKASGEALSSKKVQNRMDPPGFVDARAEVSARGQESVAADLQDVGSAARDQESVAADLQDVGSAARDHSHALDCQIS
jgi:hypothetical protein